MTNSRHSTKAAAVVSLRSDAEVDAKAKEIQSFDALLAEYATIAASWLSGVPDEKAGALNTRGDDLLWQIIRTPAPMPRQIDDKLELLRELIKTEWRDCRTDALLESIRHDVEGMA